VIDADEGYVERPRERPSGGPDDAETRAESRPSRERDRIDCVGTMLGLSRGENRVDNLGIASDMCSAASRG